MKDVKKRVKEILCVVWVESTEGKVSESFRMDDLKRSSATDLFHLSESDPAHLGPSMC